MRPQYSRYIAPIIFAALYASLAPSAPCATIDPLQGLLYNISSYFNGGTISHSGVTITIPENYRIFDVQAGNDRIFVTACYDSDSNENFRSEFWMFDIDNLTGEIPFENHKVLVSYDLRGGEALHLCHSIVGNYPATALYVQKWEKGTTRIFDTSGQEIPVQWPRYRIDGDIKWPLKIIRPIGWFQDSQGNYRLACMGTAPGDEFTILLYSPETGKIEMGPLDSMLSEHGEGLFIAFSNFRW